MKVYIYDDHAGTMHAITETGERLMHHDSSEQPFTQDDVLTFRDSLNQFYGKKYRLKMLWVHDPDTHPVLSKILAQEEARAAEEEATPATGEHLCNGCAHELVCVGRREAETIGFTITACEQHVALPTGEDHE